jgi:hypothetical protein
MGDKTVLKSVVKTTFFGFDVNSSWNCKYRYQLHLVDFFGQQIGCWQRCTLENKSILEKTQAPNPSTRVELSERKWVCVLFILQCLHLWTRSKFDFVISLGEQHSIDNENCWHIKRSRIRLLYNFENTCRKSVYFRKLATILPTIIVIRKAKFQRNTLAPKRVCSAPRNRSPIISCCFFNSNIFYEVFNKLP